MKMTDKDAIRLLSGESGSDIDGAFALAISALRERIERENPKPLTLSIEAAADAIDLIERNGGCPPDKDCAEKQDCHKCYIEWLTSRLTPKEAANG